MEGENAAHKRRRLLCEPDVVVVVGGQEFKHYSHFLCSASDYFDAALNLGMKEGQEKRVTLSGDWDREEWKQVVSKFFEPAPVDSSHAAMVTKDNIEMLLPGSIISK